MNPNWFNTIKINWILKTCNKGNYYKIVFDVRWSLQFIYFYKKIYFHKKIYFNSTEVKEKSWQKLPLILSASAPWEVLPFKYLLTMSVWHYQIFYSFRVRDSGCCLHNIVIFEKCIKSCQVCSNVKNFLLYCQTKLHDREGV